MKRKTNMKISSLCVLSLFLVMPIAFLGHNDIITSELSLPSSSNGWSLAQNKDNIKVYTKNEEGSKIKSFKAIMQVETDIQEVVEILMDFDNYTNWLADCAESKTLKKVSPQEYYYYFRTKAVWPVKDRDNIIHTTIKTSSKTHIVTFDLTVEPDYIKEKASVVRMKEFKGTWRIVPQANGLVQIEHIAHADPGGTIPKWIVNSALVNNPYNSLLNMKKLLHKPKERP